MSHHQKTVLIKMIVFFLNCVLLNLFIFCYCSNPVAGNSSQTGNNGLTVTASCGCLSVKTRPKTLVSVYEQNYRPYDTLSGYSGVVTTDDNGKYSFLSLPQGYYNLFVRDTANGKAAFVKNIPVFIDTVFTDTSKKLCLTGIFRGQFNNRGDLGSGVTIVYFNGSPFYSQIDNNGEFIIESVPSGIYTFGYISVFDNTSIEYPGELLPSIKNEEIGNITIYSDSIVEWNQK